LAHVSRSGRQGGGGDRRRRAEDRQAAAIGDRALPVRCDVLDRDAIARAVQETVAVAGTIDILINGAGGSRKEATTTPDLPFFDIQPEHLRRTLALNYESAVLPAQAVGWLFAEKKRGVILNIASIAGLRPLTRAVGYSNGKAALVSFTQWLAVHLAREYSPAIRVNALAPGFVLTDQNRFLLVDEKTGEPTARGRQIIATVPQGRYGEPVEMVGAALWLVSDSASFVTGAVIPVDGGLTAFAGV
jgi:NAD(P)-dependent dehydrogenase (short-subunit alcohol dehydrogenase family)